MTDAQALSRDALETLRRLVAQAQGPESTVPPDEAFVLAERLSPGAAITVDLQAREQIGAPVVVIRSPGAADKAAALESVLTGREKQVAMLVARGLRNREIADELGISMPTVKDHVHHILTKTGLKGRSSIAAAFSGQR